MENKDSNPQTNEWQNWDQSRRRGKVVFGVILVIAGSLFLAREIGMEIPRWIFSWEVILIAIGVGSGIKHGFTRIGWMIPIAIGSAFLLTDMFPDVINKSLIFPVLLITIGLFVIFKPRNRSQMWRKKWQQKFGDMDGGKNRYQGCGPDVTTDNSFEVVSIFGGVEKNVLSKDFTKGEVVVIMAGANINMSQAEIQEGGSIEVTAIMGGAKLIIPANWEIKSEITAIFGSVEDKRRMLSPTELENKKVLVLTGTVLFGGIEIKNY